MNESTRAAFAAMYGNDQNKAASAAASSVKKSAPVVAVAAADPVPALYTPNYSDADIKKAASDVGIDSDLTKDILSYGGSLTSKLDRLSNSSAAPIPAVGFEPLKEPQKYEFKGEKILNETISGLCVEVEYYKALAQYWEQMYSRTLLK